MSNPFDHSPLPKTPAELAAIIALVRDATRVEMSTLELESSLRTAGNKQDADRLAPKVEELSSALDRQPPDLELIRAGLFVLQPELDRVFGATEIQPDRLRNGIAAAITYARHQSQGYDVNRAEAVRRRAEWLADPAPQVLAFEDNPYAVRLLLGSGGPVEFIDMLRTGGAVYSFQSGPAMDPIVLPIGGAAEAQFFASSVHSPDGKPVSSKIRRPIGESATRQSMPPLPQPKTGGGASKGL